MTWYQCERCGGTGQQQAGLYNANSDRYDSVAGRCDDCVGMGRLMPLPDLLLAYEAQQQEIERLEAEIAELKDHIAEENENAERRS